jgi:hypothetical protein
LKELKELQIDKGGIVHIARTLPVVSLSYAAAVAAIFPLRMSLFACILAKLYLGVVSGVEGCCG